MQVRDLLKVEWIEGDPARGLDYVFLADEDYQKVQGSVKAALRVQPDGEHCCGRHQQPQSAHSVAHLLCR